MTPKADNVYYEGPGSPRRSMYLPGGVVVGCANGVCTVPAAAEKKFLELPHIAEAIADKTLWKRAEHVEAPASRPTGGSGGAGSGSGSTGSGGSGAPGGGG